MCGAQKTVKYLAAVSSGRYSMRSNQSHPYPFNLCRALIAANGVERNIHLAELFFYQHVPTSRDKSLSRWKSAGWRRCVSSRRRTRRFFLLIGPWAVLSPTFIISASSKTIIFLTALAMCEEISILRRWQHVSDRAPLLPPKSSWQGVARWSASWLVLLIEIFLLSYLYYILVKGYAVT